MGVVDDARTVDLDCVGGHLRVQDGEGHREVQEVFVEAEPELLDGGGGRIQGELQLVAQRGGVAGQRGFAGGGVGAGEVHPAHHAGGVPVGGLEHPDGAGVAAFGKHVERLGAVGIGLDLEAADGLFSGAVGEADQCVDARDHPVGDARGAPGFDNLVAQVWVGDLGRGDADVEKLRVDATSVDGGERPVAGDPEVGAQQRAEAVGRVRAVVVVGARLQGRVADGAVGAVEDVPVRQHGGAAGVGVVDDRAEGAGGDTRVRDAHAGHERIDAAPAGIVEGLRHDLIGQGVAALDDVGGQAVALGAQRFRDDLAAERFQRRHVEFPADGELDAGVFGADAVGHFEADAD